MIKNLYTPAPKKTTKIINKQPSILDVFVLTYGYSRLKNFLSKNRFSIFCKWYSNHDLYTEGTPVVIFYEHLGEEKSLFIEFFNHLKTIYENSEIYIVIDDVYEGLITQADIENLVTTIDVTDWVVVTSNLKLQNKKVLNCHYHLYDKEWDNTVIAETNFTPNLKPRNKKFLCLNRQERLHRLEIVDYFIEKNIIKHSHISCQDLEFRYVVDAIDPVKQQLPTSQMTIEDFFKNRKYGGLAELKEHTFNSHQINRLKSNLPLYIEGESYVSLNPKAMPNAREFYNDSYWAIVTERDFYRSNEYEGYTEKTVKCLLFGIPFIIVGLPYTLKHLRNQGFFTFGAFIDESYDEIEDDNLRLQAIKKQIDYLASLNYTELDLMYKKMIPILKYNYENLQRVHASAACSHLANLIQLWSKPCRQA